MNLLLTPETTDEQIEEQQIKDFIDAWNKTTVYGKTSLEIIEREMAIDHGEIERVDELGQLNVEELN